MLAIVSKARGVVDARSAAGVGRSDARPGPCVAVFLAAAIADSVTPDFGVPRMIASLVLLDMGAMLLSMAVGMLVPHALGHLLCGASSSS
ncbi:MAG: hypothetical protein ACYS0E_11410 [Planctomycetota bacterium]|jgi:hypothetical protein